MKHKALMVLCYEKKALCSSCKTYPLFIIYKSVERSLLSYSTHAQYFKQSCVCGHPMYSVLLLHMHSLLLCKNTNQPSFSRLEH